MNKLTKKKVDLRAVAFARAWGLDEQGEDTNDLRSLLSGVYREGRRDALEEAAQWLLERAAAWASLPPSRVTGAAGKALRMAAGGMRLLKRDRHG